MDAENNLYRLFEQHFGSAPSDISKLAGAGSNRTYYRVTGTDRDGNSVSVIGTIGTDIAENEAFIYLSRHFSSLSLPVPEVLTETEDRSAYLQTDLGNDSLFDRISSGRKSGEFSEKEISLLEATVKMLPLIQFRGDKGLDYSQCYPSCCLDDKTINGDLSYFKYDFLKPSGLEFSERRLDNELSKLSGKLSGTLTDNCGFMIRDFQSRNIMVGENGLHLIDFQSGRKGPAVYDVVSFLWQAKAGIPTDLRNRLIDCYISEALKINGSFCERRFRESLPYFVLFRLLQTLGAYGFRGLIERKVHFIQSIPTALLNLKSFLNEQFVSEFPYLTLLASRLGDTLVLQPLIKELDLPSFDGLSVTVRSFSYKRGVPIDPFGNGGGFVFDCRAVHNPGRYEQYRRLTGRDAPVIRFLEEDGEINEFLNHSSSLVDASVERYIKRGFSSLTVDFGCTGGQHRSVYSAEFMARHLHEQFPQIRIVLHHRERGIFEVVNPVDTL